MAIRLFDSLTRELRELRPAQPDGVFRFYNCGLTVYAAGHIGNFRTFVINDVIRRLLELEFGADKVRHVRNLTDVDDRTIAQALKEKRPLGDITRHWTKVFHEDCAALNLLPPHVEPSATDHIAEQVQMIENLIAKGHAYVADGSVYFKIGSFPEYGALSRIKERELKVTNTAADSDHKDNIGDFALWKSYKPEEDGDVRWPGPRGAAAGRPGWHIECSAMIRKHLGETIDLHTGGVDLLFPHHENEIAQSECSNHEHPFAHHWYHSEHLLVNGTKMSKSLGNYYTLRDLVDKGYSPMAVRYALLAGHPRKQLNFTLDSLHAAESALNSLRTFRAALQPGGSDATLFAPVFAALDDDLNIPGALGALFTIVNRGAADVGASAFDRVMFALGLNLAASAPLKAEAPAAVSALAEKRWSAKKSKDFATADKLRAEITAAGWSMLDGKDGYKLEPLKR